jgi:Ca2+-binding EF-hand superfamily protein
MALTRIPALRHGLNFGIPGQHNVTYVGSNSNGSVSMTWNVSVDFSPYDVNQDGSVGIDNLVIVSQHFGENTTAPYPRYDVNQDGKVDILDMTLVANHIGT